MIGLLSLLWAAVLPGRLYVPDEAALAAACQEGSGSACGELAWGWAAGAWGEPDRAKAWAKASGDCAAGSGGACIAALLLVRGHPELDPDERGWTERGCDAGLYYACADLGRRYTEGRGVPADPARARSAWSRACGITPGYACEVAAGTWPEGPPPGLPPEQEALVQAAGLRYEPPPAFSPVKARERDQMPGSWAIRSPSGRVEVRYLALPWSALAGSPELAPCRRPGGAAMGYGESAACDRMVELMLSMARQNLGFDLSGAMPLRDAELPLMASMLEFGSDTAQVALIRPDPEQIRGFSLGAIYAFYRAGAGLAAMVTLLREPSDQDEAIACLHSLRFAAPVEDGMPRTLLPWHTPGLQDPPL